LEKFIFLNEATSSTTKDIGCLHQNKLVIYHISQIKEFKI